MTVNVISLLNFYEPTYPGFACLTTNVTKFDKTSLLHMHIQIFNFQQLYMMPFTYSARSHKRPYELFIITF